MVTAKEDYSRFKILTSSGIYVNYVTPSVDSILIHDIAHGLSNECRYAGQCLQFYSVAQHCVLASYFVPNELAMEALFHDSTEAYLKDLPTWLKMLLPGYKEIEENFEIIIRTKFGLPLDERRYSNKKIIKEVDYKLLATEKRDLMPRDGEDWVYLKDVSPMPFSIVPWSPKEAKEKFLARYEELRSIHERTSNADST
jgi:5'-deoxynucleotidase YfbR-like HD superfamily hydrolase